MAGGKFDEHYDTPDYALYSDEWEPYHIRVTYKPTNQVVLRAGTGYCDWYGETSDYTQLWKEVDNHKSCMSPLLHITLAGGVSPLTVSSSMSL